MLSFCLGSLPSLIQPHQQALNRDPVAYTYINNALAEARMLGCFADVVACLSPAYARIDSNRQSASDDHAFMASIRHNSSYSRSPQASKSTVDKKASIKELQNHLDQCQATIARLWRENEAMLSLAHMHDHVSKAVT